MNEQKMRAQSFLETMKDPSLSNGIKPELLSALCDGLDFSNKPVMMVSRELMVLEQTLPCDLLMQTGHFYPLQDYLPQNICEAIQICIHEQTKNTVCARLGNLTWEIEVIPVEQSALLFFQQEENRQIGITMAAANIRAELNHIVSAAAELQQDKPEQARVLRVEQLRISRQLQHLELLCGAEQPKQFGLMHVHEFLKTAEQQLKELNVDVTVQLPKDDISLSADEELLFSAVMTLISNSIRHGKAEHIRLFAEKHNNSILFAVEDDGCGLSDLALERMDSSWKQPDAMPGAWGLGIPYARKVAQLHGGMLIFRQIKQGCSAVLMLPADLANGESLHNGMMYRAFMNAGIAELELSSALQPENYPMLPPTSSSISGK